MTVAAGWPGGVDHRRNARPIALDAQSVSTYPVAVLSQTAPVRRLSVEDVLEMVRAGILGEDDRVELVGGVLVEMSPIDPAHSRAVRRLMKHFVQAEDSTFEVRVQDMFLTPDGGYFEPDLIVYRPLPDDPQPRTAQLVVEVANTSRRRDDEKASTYAPAGVVEYWILDLNAREAVVHRRPAPDGYGEVRVHGPNAMLTPPVAAPAVSVAALLA